MSAPLLRISPTTSSLTKLHAPIRVSRNSESMCKTFRVILGNVTDKLRSIRKPRVIRDSAALLHTHMSKKRTHSHTHATHKSLRFSLFQSVPSDQMRSQVGSMVLDATEWTQRLVLPAFLQYCVPLLIVSSFPRFRIVPLSPLLVDCFPIPLQVFLRVGHLYCWTTFYFMSHRGTLIAALLAFPPG